MRNEIAESFYIVATACIFGKGGGSQREVRASATAFLEWKAEKSQRVANNG